MVARRRTVFPGVSQDATRELIGLQEDQQRDTADLRAEAIGSSTDTKTVSGYAAKYNEIVPVLFPAAGGTVVFPAAGTGTGLRWIDVIVKAGSGPCIIAPTSLLVDNAATVTLTVAGRYSFRSDGLTSWWRATNGASGGGGLSPVADETVLANVSGGVAVPTALALSSLAGTNLTWNSATNKFDAAGGGGSQGWDDTLAIDPTSGANNPIVSAGQFLQLGAVGPTTGSPQLRSGDAILRMRGSSSVIVTADGPSAALNCEGNGGVAAVQTFGTNGLVLLSATGSLRAMTAGAIRLEIAATGEWTTPAGSSGQVLTHQGAGVPPIWAAAGGGGTDPRIFAWFGV